MFPNKYIPAEPVKETLDVFLAHGWFRMRQEIFTTHFLQFGGQYFDAIWLRIALRDFSLSASQAKIIRRCGSFNAKTGPFHHSDEIERLYGLYREGIDFDISQNLDELLGDPAQNVFDTQVIKVYDGTRLIAAGFFDTGDESAAGISSIYDPAYKQYSLGKYLVLRKLDYCRQYGFKYFYPGYIVPGHARFSYKESIDPGASEYFDITQQTWLPYKTLQWEQTPLRQLNDRLLSLKNLLQIHGIDLPLQAYKFFDAALWFGFASHLLPYPVVGYYDYNTSSHKTTLLVYNVVQARYEMLLCRTAYGIGLPGHQNGLDDMILAIEETMWSTPDLAEIPGLLAQKLNSRHS